MRSIQQSADRRAGSIRDRRDRGVRGPLALPSAHAPAGVPAQRTPSAVFDDITVRVAERLRLERPGEMDHVDIGVEDCPLLPEGWEKPVPYSTHVAGDGSARARLVLFRRPLATRARSNPELATLIHDTLLEELAALWGSSVDHPVIFGPPHDARP